MIFKVVRKANNLLKFSALNLLKQLTKKDVLNSETPFLQDFRERKFLTHGRVEHLIDISKGKKVVHFGFADAPFTKGRIDTKEILHLKLKTVCSELVGIDYDEAAVNDYVKATNDTNAYSGNIYDLSAIDINLKDYEIILLGEIIEHLSNPGIALDEVCKHISDTARLVVSVPNGFGFWPFQGSLNNVELIHHDHVAWYSMYTLSNLLSKHGFDVVESSYYSFFDDSQFFFSRLFRKSFPLLGDGLFVVCQKSCPRK